MASNQNSTGNNRLKNLQGGTCFAHSLTFVFIEHIKVLWPNKANTLPNFPTIMEKVFEMNGGEKDGGDAMFLLEKLCEEYDMAAKFVDQESFEHLRNYDMPLLASAHFDDETNEQLCRFGEENADANNIGACPSAVFHILLCRFVNAHFGAGA